MRSGSYLKMINEGGGLPANCNLRWVKMRMAFFNLRKKQLQIQKFKLIKWKNCQTKNPYLNEIVRHSRFWQKGLNCHNLLAVVIEICTYTYEYEYLLKDMFLYCWLGMLINNLQEFKKINNGKSLQNIHVKQGVKVKKKEMCNSCCNK